jgi:hypothetical protein
MRKTAVYGTSAVVLATAINLTHTVSHVGQNVFSLEAWQWVYVIVVIYLAPIVAAVLLWTPLRLAGARLLLGSMAGSLASDCAYHFLIPGPDNVFTLERGWRRSGCQPYSWLPRADSEPWSVAGLYSGSSAQRPVRHPEAPWS